MVTTNVVAVKPTTMYWTNERINHELSVYSRQSFTGSMIHVDAVANLMRQMRDELQQRIEELHEVMESIPDFVKKPPVS